MNVHAIDIRRWEDGSVLFSRLSGDTLFFDALATTVLDLLSAGCPDEQTLHKDLSTSLRIPVDQDLTLYVDSLLTRLQELGLWETESGGRRRVPPRRTRTPAVPGEQSSTASRYTGAEEAQAQGTGVWKQGSAPAPNQQSAISNQQLPPLRIGRFTYAVSIRIPEAADAFARLYANYPPVNNGEMIDFRVSLDPYFSLRRPWQRLAVFSCDGIARFGPFPRREAVPYLEWGLNSCVARWSPYHLMMHAATVERDGRGILLAGASGSGKSTLAAALMKHGCRLLSDEFALIRTENGALDAMVRPVCVKNEMIPLMQTAFPDAVFGPSSPGERKGIVAHMRPPTEAIQRAKGPAPPDRLVFVKYQSDTETTLTTISKAEAMKRAVAHCFNYKRLGEQGFELLANTVAHCTCHELIFDDVFDAVQFLEKEFDHG